MQYIHEYEDWPHLTWDTDSLSAILGDIRRRQGFLLGRMSTLGFSLRAESNLETMTFNLVKSWAIEGEVLDQQQVRSSLAQKLGIDSSRRVSVDRSIDGMVEMMLDAASNYDEPLTKERLFCWHKALFPTGQSDLRTITVGGWRTELAGRMQVVSGPIGREKVHFEAPPANRVDQEMRIFLDWFNSSAGIDPVLKSGIAHFWFVTIHPFEDGNGRMARAISDMVLAQSDGCKERFYSLSYQIEKERKNYYKFLERSQKDGLDITSWLEWYLACLGRAIENANTMLDYVLRKEAFWKKVNQFPINPRQRRVINRLLDNFMGKLTSSKYAKLSKCSQDTALRDIRELIQYGILEQNSSGGRSTSYRLVET